MQDRGVLAGVRAGDNLRDLDDFRRDKHGHVGKYHANKVVSIIFVFPEIVSGHAAKFQNFFLGKPDQQMRAVVIEFHDVGERARRYRLRMSGVEMVTFQVPVQGDFPVRAADDAIAQIAPVPGAFGYDVVHHLAQIRAYMGL